MTEISELKSWIENAEEDYSAAKVLIQLRKHLTSGACFHAQQCAVRRRYPGDQPTLEEAKEAIKIAGTIRKFSRNFLGFKRKVSK